MMADANSDLIMSTSMSGVSFDVVLSPPKKAATPPARASSKSLQSPTANGSPQISLQAIETKMKAAEEKREKQLDEKIGKIKEHEKHVSEVRKSRDMHTLTSGEDSLRKMMMIQELRTQQLDDLVQKLKEHEKSIEQVHKMIAKRNEDETEELERQLGDASLHRDMVLLAIREKQNKDGQHPQAKAKENVTP